MFFYLFIASFCITKYLKESKSIQFKFLASITLTLGIFLLAKNKSLLGSAKAIKQFFASPGSFCRISKKLFLSSGCLFLNYL